MTDYDQLIEKSAVRPEEPRREPRGSLGKAFPRIKVECPVFLHKTDAGEGVENSAHSLASGETRSPLARTVHILQIVFPAAAREMGLGFLREFQRVFKAP